MQGWTKLFPELVTSTIWREPDHVRLVWITMLAITDKDGVVKGSVPGLADLARVDVSKCVEALERLASPDEWSRTQEHEGRRIESVDGGWRLLNHAKYREKRDKQARREYQAAWARERRQRRRQASTDVDRRRQCRPKSTHTDTDTYTDTEPHPPYPPTGGGSEVGERRQRAAASAKARCAAMPDDSPEHVAVAFDDEHHRSTGKRLGVTATGRNLERCRGVRDWAKAEAGSGWVDLVRRASRAALDSGDVATAKHPFAAFCASPGRWLETSGNIRIDPSEYENERF